MGRDEKGNDGVGSKQKGGATGVGEKESRKSEEGKDVEV